MLMLIQCVGFPFTLPVYVWISIKCKKVVPEVEGNKNVNDKISNINLPFKDSHVLIRCGYYTTEAKLLPCATHALTHDVIINNF